MPDPAEKTYEVSGPGEAAEKQHRSEFETLLKSVALTLMRKRGSVTLDETDFRHAYGRLLETDAKSKWREGIAEAGVFIGGGLLAYGTTLVLEPAKQPPTSSAPGVWLIIAGCLIAGLAIAFRHWTKS